MELLQEVANQQLFVFFLAGRGRKQAVLSGRPGLVLDLRVSCGADIIGKMRGFGVEVELEWPDGRACGKLGAFKEKRGLAARLADAADPLKGHDKIINPHTHRAYTLQAQQHQMTMLGGFWGVQ